MTVHTTLLPTSETRENFFDLQMTVISAAGLGGDVRV